MALSDNEVLKFVTDPMYREYSVKAGAIEFFESSMVMIAADGYAILGDDTATMIFVGFATEYLNQVTGGSDGDNKIRVLHAKSGKVVKVKYASVAITNLFQLCYIVDDEAVAAIGTTTNDIVVGTVVGLAETNYCWVLLDQ